MYEMNLDPAVTMQAALRHGPYSTEVFETVLTVNTRQRLEFIDLTDHINACLLEHRVQAGQVIVFSLHTTAAIKINEAEELLLEDFKRLLWQLCPPERNYAHNDLRRRKPPIAPDERANAHSHCMHLLLPTSETIPVSDGRLMLGTWQRVLLAELDGPRQRRISLRLISYRLADHDGRLSPIRLRNQRSPLGNNGYSERSPQGR
jgi:secondary thiamine-phosphate synthase enzyme